MASALTTVVHATVSTDDQVKAYIRKIMSQLSKWMFGGKISKLVIVITSKDTGENLERWQFDVQVMGGGGKGAKKQPSASVVDGAAGDKENVQLRYVAGYTTRIKREWRRLI